MEQNETTRTEKKNLWCRIICSCYHMPRNIAYLLFGEKSKTHHKIGVGLVIIAIGTYVAGVMSHGLAGLACEAIGFLIHAIGSVPFIEALGRVANSSTAAAAVVAAEPIVENTMTYEEAMEMEQAINGNATQPEELHLD